MKIFMIAMKDHPISEMYRRHVMPSWKGHQVNVYDAVTPKDLAYKTALRFGSAKITRKGKRAFTETEKAVWYSHYELWCRCLTIRESVLIIEHDSMLSKPLPELRGQTHKFLSYVTDDRVEHPVLAPGSGYFLTPPSAAVLVAYAVANPIITNSDGHLAHFLRADKEKQLKDYDYIEQVSIDGLNTIDHMNPKKKFVGPDYENFDLSSVYGQAL